MDELIERARRGERAAIEELLASIAPAVYRFGRRMCKNAQDADDVLQDTLLNVAEHIGQLQERSALTSWVLSITRSACARRRRGLKNEPLAGEDALREQVSSEPSPERRAAEQELSSLLEQALHALPEPQREVLLLRDVEGLSAPETATLLGISAEAVKSRLHRARAALRERMTPLFASVPPRASRCPDLMLLWSRKLDGDLSQADCAKMERHVESCNACRAGCDALKQVLELCQSLPREPAPDDLPRRVELAARAAERKSR